jgi:predicted ferric reductase
LDASIGKYGSFNSKSYTTTGTYIWFSQGINITPVTNITI